MRQKRVNPLLQNFEEHGAAINFCESGFPVEAVCRNSVFRLKVNCAYVFLFAALQSFPSIKNPKTSEPLRRVMSQIYS